LTPRARRLAPKRLALAVGLALAGGCGPSKPQLVDFSNAARTYRSLDYSDVYRRWTRHTKVRRIVEPAIEVWATYKSWDFREAYVEHYAQIYSLPQAEVASLRAGQLEMEQSSYEIHMAVQSSRFEWLDLEKSSSAWQVSLVDGTGRAILPEKIEVLKYPDAYEAEFFPDRTPFTRSYRVRFPRAAIEGPAAGFQGVRTGRITLRLASPLGRAELVWQSK